MVETFGTESACVGMGSTCGGCGPGSTIGCGCSERSRSPGCACKGLWGGWRSCGWVSWMAKGSSITAASPIAGSLDDKMVPKILAARTEMADFLVHSYSCWTLARTVVWTVLSSRTSALTMSRDRLSLYRYETLFTSIPSPECTGKKEPLWGIPSQDLRYLCIRSSSFLRIRSVLSSGYMHPSFLLEEGFFECSCDQSLCKIMNQKNETVGRQKNIPYTVYLYLMLIPYQTALDIFKPSVVW
jgi:hypothetical protein